MEAEVRLDQQIDALLQKRRTMAPASAAEAELLAVARAVRQLHRPKPARTWRALPVAATLVAAVVMVVLLLPFGGAANVVQAMEQAVARIDSYHAVIEHRFVGPDGKAQTDTEEVWYAGGRYAWKNRGYAEVISNGEREWRIDHRNQHVEYGFPITPQLYPFQPANLTRAVADQPFTVEGEEEIAGRRTVRVRFEVPNLKSYHIWIDNETKLPLQMQMKHWSGTTSTMTYQRFVPNTPIDSTHFTYTAPQGYAVTEGGVRVSTLDEAAAMVGFQPAMPSERPQIIVVRGEEIQMGFGDVEMIASRPLQMRLDSRMQYGWTGEVPVHTMGRNHYVWNQQGVGIRISGSERATDLARQIAPDLSLPYEPYSNPYLLSLIEEMVAVDMDAAMAAEIEHAKDLAAHWERALPLPVAQRFVAATASVPEEAFRQAGNNGAEAIVTVSEGPISKVYLRRVARQDEQGLWWVIGYDRR